MLDIQADIDALPESGGDIFIPPGDYRDQGIIVLKPQTRIRGCGDWTTIAGLMSVPGSASMKGVSVENITIRRNPLINNQYGANLRFLERAKLSRVVINDFDYGLIVADECYHCEFDGVFADGRVEGLEVFNSSNQHTFSGGKFSAPICAHIISSNGITFSGTSLESPSGITHFVKLQGSTPGVGTSNVRCETTGLGPFFLNGPIVTDVVV